MLSSDIRFFVAGYLEDRGYAVKDLSDSIVEYFSYEEVIEMSKLVKIYGVENGVIDLDWFKKFYTRYVMAFGLSKTLDDLGVIMEGDGEVLLYCLSPLNINTKFIEFVNPFSYRYSDSRFRMPVNKYEQYLVDSNSAFMHYFEKVKDIGIFSTIYINKLNIHNILEDGAVVNFTDAYNYGVKVSDLQMHNCVYHIFSNSEISLRRVSDDVDINISMGNISASSAIIISSEFDLNKLHFGHMIDLPIIMVESGVDIDKFVGIVQRDIGLRESYIRKSISNL